MISDVLSDSVREIDGYLENPTFERTYSGELRERIIKLRNDMDAMRQELDTPPTVKEPL